MKRIAILMFVSLLLLLSGSRRFNLRALGIGALNPSPAPAAYVRDPNWPGKLPAGWKYRMVSTIAGDSTGRIYVVHRAAHPILIFNKQGKFLGSLGDNLFKKSVALNYTKNPPTPISREYWLHGITVDRSNNVWVTDIGRQIVMKISPQGKLLMTLGTPDKIGHDEKTFYMPTSVAVAPSGDIYVADGYGNSRIVKFSPQGKYLMSWGKRGSGPGEFNIPHGITVDAQGNVYVAERVNNRVQVFDPDGHFLAQWRWPGYHGADSILMAREGGALVGFGQGPLRIIHCHLNGKLIQAFGSFRTFGYPHGMYEDADGSLYIADPVDGNASRPPRKFVRVR